MEYHNFNGMAMYLQVGDEDQMNALPSYMRKCGNFNWSNEQFNDLQQNRVTAGESEIFIRQNQTSVDVRRL